ncbi:MAG: hypothetical protein JWO78_269 [Micavibrio sp.]|nr:hypothetical protein [Micavibrio sp.]
MSQMMRVMQIFTAALALLAAAPALAKDASPPPAPPAYVQHVESGTIKNACSPWGKISFVIDLNNTHTVVYGSLDAMEKGGGAVVFEADPKNAREGLAQITKCARDGNLCKLKDGIVAITTIEPETVIGVVQISMGGWGRSYNGNESHMFKAKYDRTKPACN